MCTLTVEGDGVDVVDAAKRLFTHDQKLTKESIYGAYAYVIGYIHTYIYSDTYYIHTKQYSHCRNTDIPKNAQRTQQGIIIIYYSL